MTLRAPFPWFGGKSRAADIVWRAFGDVPNYVEPFAGSLAVMLGRQSQPGTETVNDADCFLANFWRSLQHEPDLVAELADWPVNEADLHARHRWLVTESAEFKERMKREPEFYCPQRAAWWVWGLCQWIGSGWCQSLANQLPHLGDAGRGVHRKTGSYFADLATRLRRVRVACGDWSRVCTPSVTSRHGITGVLLDPPYGDGAVEYAAGGNADTAIADAVREWAISEGGNAKMRIALCGYEGQHVMPADWRVVPWKAHGGYGSGRGGQADENAHRERVWLSPHCLGNGQSELFGH